MVSIRTQRLWKQPEPWWQAPELWLLAGVLVAGSLLITPEGDTVRLTFWPGTTLPEVCAARRWFGWRCPLCGATRSCLWLLRGDWKQSWAWHRLGWWCLGVMVVTAAVSVFCRVFRPVSTEGSERFTRVSWLITAGLLLLNRCAELCGW